MNAARSGALNEETAPLKYNSSAPVQNILTIESKENIESIQVYSMLGELLASEKGKSQIDFSTYTKGIYFLKIDTEKGFVFQKILKE